MKKLVLFAAILFSTTLFSCGRATTTEGADNGLVDVVCEGILVPAPLARAVYGQVHKVRA